MMTSVVPDEIADFAFMGLQKCTERKSTLAIQEMYVRYWQVVYLSLALEFVKSKVSIWS